MADAHRKPGVRGAITDMMRVIEEWEIGT